MSTAPVAPASAVGVSFFGTVISSRTVHGSAFNERVDTAKGHQPTRADGDGFKQAFGDQFVGFGLANAQKRPGLLDAHQPGLEVVVSHGRSFSVMRRAGCRAEHNGN